MATKSFDYPGIQKIGHVDSFRLSSDSRTTRILFFAFDEGGITAATACKAFDKHFDQSSTLEAFCHKVHFIGKKQIVVIQALFADQVGVDRIVEEASVSDESQQEQRTITMAGGGDAILRATVHRPAPATTRYMVYTLQGLPLESPDRAIKIVKEAVTKRIKHNGNLSKYIKDILLDKHAQELMQSARYYNGRMSVILSSNAIFTDGICLTYVNIDGMMYGTGGLPPKGYYFYCSNCRSLDQHDSIHCPAKV